jgi:hypothetical protein
MTRLLPATTCLIALAGCGIAAQQRLTQHREALKAAYIECATQAKAGGWTLVHKGECLTAADNTYLRPDFRYGDLLSVFQAQRQVLAGRVDRGELRLDEAVLQNAQNLAAVGAEEARRNNEAGIVSAAQGAAAAQQGAVNNQMIYLGARLLQGR